MPNEFYDHTGFPQTNTRASSALMRAELDAVEQGFDKLPVLAGNGGEIVTVKADATGLESKTQVELHLVRDDGDVYTGAHDFTGATITAPTQSTADSSTKVATTAFVNNVAMNPALPNQTGNAGKFVTTDGTNASWGSVGTTLQTLGIFSAAAATVNPVSSMDVIENGVYQTSLDAGAQLHLAASSTLFCAAHISNGVGSNVSTSPDGITWTSRALSTASNWTIESDGTGFLAVENAATVVNYSATGVTFSVTTSLPGNRQTGANLVSRTTGEYMTRGTASTTTLYHTVNNGTTWTTQTAPVANMNTLQVNSGLYVGSAGGSSYYTSATGLTGSWTTRTLPGTCTDIKQHPDGTLAAYDGNKVTEQYISSNAIDWTLVANVPYTSAILGATRISGSFATNSCTLATLHNGKWISRKSNLDNMFASGLLNKKSVVKKGNLIVASVTTSNYNNVALIDLSNSATAYFEA